MPNKETAAAPPITIKKYANRRLYNTATSSYVTLDDLCSMVKDGTEFVVYDAKTGEDITRSVLTQIIVEEEAKGPNLLPISFLRQLIAYYGDSLQGLVPKYLEHSMANFAQHQEQMRTYVTSAFDGMFPFGSLEEMGKQNIAFMEQALKMFTPPAPGGPPKGGNSGGKAAEPDAAAAQQEPPPAGDVLGELQKRIDALQEQVESLSKSRAEKD